MKFCNCKNNVLCTTVNYMTVTDVGDWYFSSVNAGDMMNKVQSSA